jgi:hypothetical protein
VFSRGVDKVKPIAGDDGAANTPLLAQVETPWAPGETPTVREMLKALPPFLSYERKYGPYLVPKSLDAWSYRRALRGLDPACLDALSVHGALSLEELTKWLNRGGGLRLHSDKTGIRSITAPTTRDWIELARRRGLIVSWKQEGGGDDLPVDRSSHWALSERGREELLTPLQRIGRNVSLTGLLSVVFGGGAVFGWIGSNGIVLAVALFALGLAIYLGFIWLLAHASQRRAGPGAAVVTIETLRSSGKPIPPLGGEVP